MDRPLHARTDGPAPAGGSPAPAARAAAAAALALTLLLLAACATLLAPTRAAAASWTPIAPLGSNPSIAPIPGLAWDGTKLWGSVGSETLSVNVASWNGISWSPITAAGTNATRNTMPAIAWSGTRIWVAYNDDAGAVQVKNWNGAAWTSITSPGGTGSGAIYSTPDIKFVGGVLHVAYQDGSRNVQVKSWNGASWSAVGASPGGGGAVNTYPVLGWDGAKEWVAYNDASNSVQVKTWNGASWVAHSTLAPGAGINTLPALMFVNGRAYLSSTSASNIVTFRWWNGLSWLAAPTPGVAQGAFAYSNIEWDGTNLWMAHGIDNGANSDAEVDEATDATPPAPTGLGQFESNGTTPIASGGWTSSGSGSNLVLTFTMKDPDAGEVLTPWVEVEPQGTPFSATCGQYASATTTYFGAGVTASTANAGVTGTVDVTGLANNTSYVWRACTVDQWGFPGAWTARGSVPDLRADYSVPTVALVSPGAAATVGQLPTLTATYTDPAPANQGQLDFQLCTDAACTSVSQSGSTATTIASGSNGSFNPTTIAPGSYFWRARAVDMVGNVGTWSATRALTVNASIVVSGFAYADEAATPTVWSQCNGATANVSVSFDGGAPTSVPCSAATGAFTANVLTPTSDAVIAIWLNPAAAGDKGVVYTRNVDTATAIAGIRVTKDRTWIRSESGTPVTNASIDTWDASQDADIPAASNGVDLVLAAGQELHVGTGATYESGGNVTASHVHVAGRYVGWPTEVLTLTGGGTAACTTGPATERPLCIDPGGSFLPQETQRTRFTATTPVEVQPAAYARLELQPAGAGSPTWQLGASGGGAVSAGRLTIGDGTNPVTVSTATWGPGVDVYGDLVVSAGASLLGAGAGTFSVLGNTTGAGTVTMSASPFDHRVAGTTASIGTTSGASAWSFANLRTSDYAPPAWNVNGTLAYNSGAANSDRVNTSIRDSFGNLYVAGWDMAGGTGHDFAVARYTPSGALDGAWGTGGFIHYNSSASVDDDAWDLAVDGRGALYVGGTTNVASAAGSNWAVRKYTPTGTLDASFGVGGMVTWDSGVNQQDVLSQLIVDADGNVYAGGVEQANGTDWVVRRYDSNGVLCNGGGACPAWGTGGSGMVTYNTSGTVEDQLTALALAPDGKLYVGGYHAGTGYDWMLQRYTTAGVIDGTWAAGGTLLYTSAGSVNDIISIGSLVVDDAGNVYAGGYIGTNTTDIAVRKYDSTGTIVGGWGAGGMVTYNSGGGQDAAYQLALDDDGRLVVCGYQQTNGFDWVVLRYTAAGVLDPSFAGGAGLLTYNSGGVSTDAPRSVTIDGQGSITVAGYNALNGSDWMVRRYDPGGNLVNGGAGFPEKSVAAAGGTGTMTVGTALTVGVATDPAVSTLDLETNDRTLDINGDLAIASRGVLLASSTAPLTIAGNFTNSGTFTPNAGTTTFDTAATSTLSYAAATTFNGLTVATPSKTLVFDHLRQTNVTGPLTVNGSACNSQVNLRSDSAGLRFNLNATGTKSVQYASIGDSNAVTAATATNATTAGNDAGWTIDYLCTSLTLTADAATRNLGSALANTDDVGQTTLSVTTDSLTGYQLLAHDSNTGTGLTCGCGSIADWTGTDASPTAWGAGVGGWFGLTVLDATGGRLAKWGATGPFPATDTVNNRYLGLGTVDALLQNRTGPVGGTDAIVAQYRADPASATPPGAYSDVVTYSAVPNP